MPFVNTEHGYIFDAPVDRLINGMKYGQQLRMDLQRAADEHQAFITNQMIHNRNMSVQALMEEQKVRAAGGLPTKNGMVEEPGGPLTDVTGQTPADWGAPSDFNQQAPSVLRKAGGGGRYVVKLPNAEGQVTQYEMPSPEEQSQRLLQAQIDKATAIKRTGMTLVKATPEVQKELGLSTFWIPNEHVPQYLRESGQMEPVASPPAWKQVTGQPTIPSGMLPHAMTYEGQIAGQQAAWARTQEQIKSRESLQEKSLKARAAIAEQDRQSRESMTGQRIAGSLEAADIRAGGTGRGGALTPGQKNLQDRFTTREQDAADKAMKGVQDKEDKLHAERIQWGATLEDPTTPDDTRRAAAAKMKSVNFQIQAAQYSKAKIAKAAAPPKANQDQIPEGHQITAPDGHVWAKKDGIVYFLK